MKYVYIIKARVTDPEYHDEPCRVGDIEWRLMEDCPIFPSSCTYYLNLEDIMYDNAGLPMVFYGDEMLAREGKR